MKRVFHLYGIDNSGTPLSMFFEKRKHLLEFVESVPGTYSRMTLEGIGYDDFRIRSVFALEAPAPAASQLEAWRVGRLAELHYDSDPRNSCGG